MTYEWLEGDDVRVQCMLCSAVLEFTEERYPNTSFMERSRIAISYMLQQHVCKGDCDGHSLQSLS